jgi:hypothetical protein
MVVLRWLLSFRIVCIAMSACEMSECPACGYRASGAPVLYTNLFMDGAGTTVMHLLAHLEYAAAAGFSFGGAATTRYMPIGPTGHWSAVRHGVEEWKILEFVFGTEHIVIDEALLPANTTLISSAAELQALDVEALHEPIWYTEKNIPHALNSSFSVSKAVFLERLRAGARCFIDSREPRITFRPHAVRVAMHLRRGDVDPQYEPEKRWVTTECSRVGVKHRA